MKLNNRGWGLGQMLVCCGILLFVLLVAVIMIRQLYNSLGYNFKDSLTNISTSSEVENIIENASLKYIADYYKKEIGTGTITITVDNLKKDKYLTNSDINVNGSNCDGYSLVTKDSEGIKADAYITCDGYTTNGFQKWRLGA